MINATNGHLFNACICKQKYTKPYSVFSPGPPLTSSSPARSTTPVKENKIKGLRVLNSNFQSIKNKVASVESLLNTTNLDIVLSTETWLTNTIQNTEVFPKRFRISRRDRHDGCGCVLIAVRNTIDYSEIEIPDCVYL